jgi:hypothetical protein
MGRVNTRIAAEKNKLGRAGENKDHSGKEQVGKGASGQYKHLWRVTPSAPPLVKLKRLG